MNWRRRSLFGFAAVAIGVAGWNALSSRSSPENETNPSDDDVMSAMLKASPNETPTTGIPVVIRGRPYLLQISELRDECKDIVLWDDRPETPERTNDLVNRVPAFKTTICG